MKKYNKQDLQSIQTTNSLLKEKSYVGKATMSYKPKPKMTQPVFESMDDIKPRAQVLPVNLEETLFSTPRQTPFKIDTAISNEINSVSNQWTEFSDKKYKLTTPTEINSYSSDGSPSGYKPRTRENTLDSVGLIKTAASITKFEDIKSEAFDSWKEGVDLRLDTTDNVKKKPKEWLPQSVFFSDSPNDKTVSPEWSQPQKSYAEATHQKILDRKTPDWALDDHQPQQQQQQQQQMAIPYGYNQNWSPTGNIPHAIPQMMMMPSPYMQMAPNMFPASSTRDNEYLIYFYKIVHDHQNTTLLMSFQKKLDKIFQRYLPEFSTRTFALLLEALVPLMEHEANTNQSETARRIRGYWQYFIFFIGRHLQMYCKLPEDLLSLLQVCNLLQRYNSKIYKELPMSDIMRVYESIKEMCSSDQSKEYIKNLKSLKAITDTSNSSWRDTDERLPSVPSAEDSVSEVVNNVDVLSDYETKKEIRIVNKVHNPWPNVDLLQYTLVHFMMMREELLKPVKNTINALFAGRSSQSIEIPHGCTVFEHTEPKSTTMLLSTSETAIVFQLGPVLAHDNIMESFEEGSFVIILPEYKTEMNPSDQYHMMMNIAKGAMMGQAIRASSHQNIRLVSIQVFKQDIARMDWSSQYTIITCGTNASSMLSILSWLRTEYVDLKKSKFSPVLTPRILAANNTLSNSQLNAWDKENAEQEVMINQDCVPFYLVGTEIDVNCLMVNNKTHHKARPGEHIWPRHPSQYEQIAASKRPALYSISPSQLSAVQFALSHRISVISGAPGTGKTHIAAKLILLMSQALNIGQFHQPLLIITKTQSCLDNILSQVVTSIPDVIRFGGEVWDQNLIDKQADKLTTPSVTDSNYRQHQHLEKLLSKNQGKLNALFLARFQASEHDPAVMCTVISPEYLKSMQRGYMDQYKQSYSPNYVTLWNKWANKDSKTKNFSKAQSERREFGHTQYMLESSYLKKAGRGLMPILNTSYLQNRFTWVAQNPVSILPIYESIRWPFDTSTRTGKELRSKIEHAWERLPKEKVWYASDEEKSQLIHLLSQIIVTYIDYEIQDVLQDQIKLAKQFDEQLTQKLTYLCRFNRVVGMTAEFAAAHRDWVSTLWPRGIIVDEASEILESTLASIVLGPRTEHLILLGNSDTCSKPKLNNPELSGHPRNLDVSLFERWKGSGSEMVLLEEQWRMCSELANVIDQFNSIKEEPDSLLITAPLASCNENMVDGSKPQEEILYGITQRAFYLDYQGTKNTRREERYSKTLKFNFTQAEVDEARFVAFFAVYLSQQRHPKPSVTILTVCLTQKYLIRAILREEVPKRTCFTSNVSKISIDTVEQNGGRQDSFTIISTATPSHSFSTFDNISFALTRAKYGLFVIGKSTDDVDNRWKDFAKYMKSRDLFGTELQLTCFEHGDTFSVSKYQDFDKMPNGGCLNPCQALMNDGHVCPEVCHFLSHDQVICKEPCNRIRPTNCAHQCKQLCFECSKNKHCPPCEEETTVTLDCGHVVKGICQSLQFTEDFKCTNKVNVTLDCGHELVTDCFKAKKPKRLVCLHELETVLSCGHKVRVKCGETPVCPEVCNQYYECGHACQEMCGIEHFHNRKECKATCPKQLICGHGCANGCANPNTHTERCVEKCNYTCSHGYKCSRDCWRDCIKCVSACPYVCKHLKCTKKCFEICDRPPCNKACNIRLDCGHTCPGLCGEPCPPCSICRGNLRCSISLRNLMEFEQDEKVYMLPECGCVFSVESLDMYFMNQSKNGEHTAVKLWACPTCQKTIYRAFRYNKFIKTEINLVNTIKLRIEKERQKLTYNEKTQIINAMNDETKQGPHNLVGGRWFVCKNQHPYFVGDCGGATEISKCPECDAPIGGTQHRVVESNRFYGEFDGSDTPAWPGQPGLPERR